MSENPHVTNLMQKAARAIESARKLLPDDPNGASNRAYYAAFHAAQAALLSVGEVTHTHAGARRQFALHFIRSGRIPQDLGAVLAQAEQLRLDADYTLGAVIPVEDVERMTSAVERFVEAVAKALHPPEPTSDG